MADDSVFKLTDFDACQKKVRRYPYPVIHVGKNHFNFNKAATRFFISNKFIRLKFYTNTDMVLMFGCVNKEADSFRLSMVTGECASMPQPCNIKEKKIKPGYYKLHLCVSYGRKAMYFKRYEPLESDHE